MSKKKVLYAEDELSNRALMEIKLKHLNIECDLAKNGQEALDLFNMNKYDLVLLDLYMPLLDGDKVAQKIREQDPEIPLIAITSDDDKENDLKAAGFNEVFIKPVHKQEYMEIIESYL